jgi:hypothetical protein
MARINPVQVQKFLGGIDYPASRDELVNRAREQGADENVMQTLEELPMDRFNGPNDVSEAIGKME